MYKYIQYIHIYVCKVLLLRKGTRLIKKNSYRRFHFFFFFGIVQKREIRWLSKDILK